MSGVGDLHTFETMELLADPAPSLLIYGAERPVPPPPADSDWIVLECQGAKYDTDSAWGGSLRDRSNEIYKSGANRCSTVAGSDFTVRSGSA